MPPALAFSPAWSTDKILALHFLYYPSLDDRSIRFAGNSRFTGDEVLSTQADQGHYGQFCPVALAAEIVGSRWTMLVLREMLAGSTRFNDLRRGVPRMSPTLLSKRLKELTATGIITANPAAGTRTIEYKLTKAGEDLREIIMGLGVWGQRWVESSRSLKNLDPSLLMWDMRRNLRPAALPNRKRCTIKFTYSEIKAQRKAWWLVIEGGNVDLCFIDPGYEVDLYVKSTLRSMTSVWMGHSTVHAETRAGTIELIGDDRMARSMPEWLGLSPFAKERTRLAS